MSAEERALEKQKRMKQKNIKSGNVTDDMNKGEAKAAKYFGSKAGKKH